MKLANGSFAMAVGIALLWLLTDPEPLSTQVRGRFDLGFRDQVPGQPRGRERRQDLELGPLGGLEEGGGGSKKADGIFTRQTGWASRTRGNESGLDRVFRKKPLVMGDHQGNHTRPTAPAWTMPTLLWAETLSAPVKNQRREMQAVIARLLAASFTVLLRERPDPSPPNAQVQRRRRATREVPAVAT